VGSLERLMDNRGRITPFVGTGATIAVLPDNPFARWDGLLEDGIRRCAQLGQPEEWAESTVTRLRSGDLITYLAVADEVSRRLAKSGEWHDWIKRTVGTLTVGDGSAMHKAICSLNRIVLTTNYDLLLEEASGHKSLHWKKYDEVREVINGDVGRAVIHLHGVATSPASVILGSWQYQTLKNDITAQFWQDVLLSRRLLFIGCGSGLNDPNIGSALEYVQFLLNPPSRSARSQSESNEPHEHYILVRGRELGAAWEKFSESNIYPVAFGPEYADLKQFLTDLADGRKPEVSQDVHAYDSSRRATAARPHGTPNAPRAIPRPGLLDLAGPAEETLQGALDVAQRALQALGQVERRSTLPTGADRWAAADQLFIHERTAASVMDPIKRLQIETKALVAAVHKADAPMGMLSGQQDQALDALFALVNELSDACDSLDERVVKCITQIKEYLKLTDHYRPAATVLHEVRGVVDDIRGTVKSLPGA
jgi:SIR2-like domain